MKKASLTFLIIGKLTGTFLIYFLLASCKKDKAVNLPRVVTYDVTNITPSSATLNGSLLSLLEYFPESCYGGHQWSKSQFHVDGFQSPVWRFFI